MIRRWEMKGNISRREFLKEAGLLGATLILPKVEIGDELDDTSFILFTDNPEKGLIDLTKGISKDFGLQYKQKGNVIVFYDLIKSYSALYYLEKHGQVNGGLTIIHDDRVIDPVLSRGMNEIKRLAEVLRGSCIKAEWKICLEIKKNSLFNLFSFNNTEKDVAEIYVDGKIVEKINLKRDYDKIIISGFAGKSVLQTKNRKIKVINSCCRSKLCIHEGEKRYGDIVCAPNRLYVKLGKLKNVDAITM